MGLSINGSTPKRMVCKRKSYWKWIISGYPPFTETPTCFQTYFCQPCLRIPFPSGVSVAAASPATSSQISVKRLCIQDAYTVQTYIESPVNRHWTLHHKIAWFHATQKREIFKQCMHAHTHKHKHSGHFQNNPTEIQQYPGPMIKALEENPANTIKTACDLANCAFWWKYLAGSLRQARIKTAFFSVLSRWISESVNQQTRAKFVWNQTGLEFLWKWVSQNPIFWIIFPVEHTGSGSGIGISP